MEVFGSVGYSAEERIPNILKGCATFPRNLGEDINFRHPLFRLHNLGCYFTKN